MDPWEFNVLNPTMLVGKIPILVGQNPNAQCFSVNLHFFFTPPGTYFFMNFPNLKPMVLGYPATPNRKAPNDQRPFPFMGNFIWYFGGFLFPIIGNVQKLLGLEISYFPTGNWEMGTMSLISFHYEIYSLSCSFLIPFPSISLAYPIGSMYAIYGNMDPITGNPLYVTKKIPAPWIRHGYGNPIHDFPIFPEIPGGYFFRSSNQWPFQDPRLEVPTIYFWPIFQA